MRLSAVRLAQPEQGNLERVTSRGTQNSYQSQLSGPSALKFSMPACEPLFPGAARGLLLLPATARAALCNSTARAHLTRRVVREPAGVYPLSSSRCSRGLDRNTHSIPGELGRLRAEQNGLRASLRHRVDALEDRGPSLVSCLSCLGA